MLQYRTINCNKKYAAAWALRLKQDWGFIPYFPLAQRRTKACKRTGDSSEDRCLAILRRSLDREMSLTLPNRRTRSNKLRETPSPSLSRSHSFYVCAIALRLPCNFACLYISVRAEDLRKKQRLLTVYPTSWKHDKTRGDFLCPR